MTNGITERVNQTLQEKLKKYVNEKGDDWDLYIEQCVFNYNAEWHSTLKMSPFKALYCRDPIFPVEYNYGSIKNLIEKNELPNNVNFIEEELHLNIEIAQKKQKIDFEKRHKIINYKVGDYVYVLRVKRGYKARKLQYKRFTNIFKVVKVLPKNIYLIKAVGSNIRKKINGYKLISAKYREK